MKLTSLNPIAAALAVSLSAAHAEPPVSPGPAKPVAEPSMAEGKCGGMTMSKPAHEGKCGGAMKMPEAKTTDEKKPVVQGVALKPEAGAAAVKPVREGKCGGEGKCGAKTGHKKKDAPPAKVD